MSKKLFSITLVIFLLSVILRWLYLRNGLITFAYDQARDAFIVKEILGGDIKILGPPTSGVPGLYHGVLYYYVIAPAYWLGNGNPFIAAGWLSFISSFGVFAVYFLAKELTRNTVASLMSALVFTFSFEAIQYANFLSNVSLGILFVPLIYLGLYKWVSQPKNTDENLFPPILTGVALGLSAQSEIAFMYHLVPLLYCLITAKNKIKKRQLFFFVFALLISTSTMVISELKFGFPAFRGLIYLLSSQDTIVKSKQFSDFLITFINQVGHTFANTIFPLNIVFGSLVGFGLVIYTHNMTVTTGKKSVISWPILLTLYLFAHIFALPFGGSTTPHIMIGSISAVAILVGIALAKLYDFSKILSISALLIILLSNMVKIKGMNKNDQNEYSANYVYLSQELDLVDYTYQSSNGELFSINTLTSPLYINTLWSYLYNWYGKSKYGYVPYWTGRDQIGLLGNNLKNRPVGVKIHYYIEEPTYGIPERYLSWGKGEEDSKSRLVEKKEIGTLVVEKRFINELSN